MRDENTAPHPTTNKTLHHRNKSTPALSTVLGNVALKNGNAPKRSAFGDVSNVVNPVRSGKDDSAIAPKEASDKPAISIQEKQPAALSRPAQRPASIANIKGLLNNVTNSNKSVNASDSRKGPLKRSNTVFKDPLPSVVEVPKPRAVGPIAIESIVARSLPPIPAVNATKPDQEVKSVEIETAKEQVNFSAPTGPSDSEALRSDGVYIDGTGEVKDYNTYEDEQSLKENINPSKVIDTEEHSVGGTIPKPVTKAPNEGVKVSHMQPEHVAIPSEPEEYWDDEDEDHYEEEDYVTAPSHRYRSDNTTGGHTTLLFPKFNQKAKRELAVAKQIVDSSRTMEDYEDELWDTSMVAEYGDEIFQYMRDLEVRFHSLPQEVMDLDADITVD